MSTKDQPADQGETRPGEGVLAAIKEAARIATEKALKRQKAAEKEIAKWKKSVEEAALWQKAAEEEAARIAAEEEAARFVAEEKAARKAAKRQQAAMEAAEWVSESILALSDGAALDSEAAVTAVQNLCDALDWKLLKNMTGCQIEFSQDPDFADSRKVKIRKSDDLTRLAKKLETGKTYYVRARVCAAGKKKKHCSDWTEVMTLKA